MLKNKGKIVMLSMLLSLLTSMNVLAEETGLEGIEETVYESNEETVLKSIDEYDDSILEDNQETSDIVPVDIIEQTCDENTEQEISDMEYVEVEEHSFFINALYSNVLEEQDLLTAEGGNVAFLQSKGSYMSWEDVISVVRNAMVAREMTVTIDYESTETLSTGWLQRLLADVMTETNSSVEGDYLKNHFGGCKSSRKTTQSSGTYNHHIVLTFTYYTTAEEEAVVTQQVNSLLNSFGFTSKTSDYDKIKAIYNWLCENVTYDYTNLNNEAYKLKFSAYAAIVNRTSVCQGYASLAYRLLKESGIDVRIITGTSSGERHAWLIAELDDLYYNLDPTWDGGRNAYKYFLKGKNTFTNHTRAAEFSTDAFNQSYPMGNEDYVYAPKTEIEGEEDVNSNSAVNKMYRLYNPNSGEHFYTASSSERDYLDKVGWVYEGIGWYAPKKGNPVYRLYNPNAGDHHYTLSSGERDFLVSVGWNYEGVGWYSDTNKSVPLYRLYNPNAVAGSHHYTVSYSEAEYLDEVGWEYEGIGWYGVLQK